MTFTQATYLGMIDNLHYADLSCNVPAQSGLWTSSWFGAAWYNGICLSSKLPPHWAIIIHRGPKCSNLLYALGHHERSPLFLRRLHVDTFRALTPSKTHHKVVSRSVTYLLWWGLHPLSALLQLSLMGIVSLGFLGWDSKLPISHLYYKLQYIFG